MRVFEQKLGVRLTIDVHTELDHLLVLDEAPQNIRQLVCKAREQDQMMSNLNVR